MDVGKRGVLLLVNSLLIYAPDAMSIQGPAASMRRRIADAEITVLSSTKVRGIRLNVDAGTGQEDHNIECRIDGFGAMKLKPAVVKKV